MELTLENLDQRFPGRKHIKGAIAKLNFDIINFFILRSTEYYEDIKQIHQSFPFDLMIADVAFSGIPFIKEKMKIPVISVSVFPLMESSKDLAPNGLGIAPANSFVGRRKQDVLRFVSNKLLFKKPNKLMKQIFADHGISIEGNVFDAMIRKSTPVLQSGSNRRGTTDASPNTKK